MEYNNAFLFTGYVASGKSTALDVCRNIDDIACFELGDLVHKMYEADNDENVSDNDVGVWASGRRELHGKGYFTYELIQNLDTNMDSIAVSGIRCPEEVMQFIESGLFSNVTVIGVTANEDVRWERFSKRDGTSHEDFVDRNTREEDWGVDMVMKFADLYLVNEFTTETRFRNKVENIIENLKEDPVHSWSESWAAV